MKILRTAILGANFTGSYWFIKTNVIFIFHTPFKEIVPGVHLNKRHYNRLYNKHTNFSMNQRVNYLYRIWQILVFTPLSIVPEIYLRSH